MIIIIIIIIMMMMMMMMHRVDGNMSIKVADFGLTRDIYQTDYYRQNHRSRVPIKWMAPESLYDRISNEKTDVVS